MKFTILRSGSSGNCTLVEHGGTRVLIDAGGFSQKRLHEILTSVKVQAERLAGIVISHLHADHVNHSTLKICREHHVGLWVHEGCMASMHDWFGRKLTGSITAHTFSDRVFRIGEISIRPFEVVHDAQGKTCGFRFWPGDEETRAVAYTTDLGAFSEDLVQHFVNTRAIVIESNHDEEMLWENPRRTMANKKRVIGAFGHLSNTQCAEALVQVLRATLTMPERIILAHLSGENNTPEKALATVKGKIGEAGFEVMVVCASRDGATECVEV
jgi:phosphoribosyl 1,2-cyclic phosphodiesterase